MTSAIVILNWNDWKNTVDCLESIYQNEGNFDVFLIDNGSSLNNLLKISNWYKGTLISDRKFIKPRLKNQGELSQTRIGVGCRFYVFSRLKIFGIAQAVGGTA